MPLSQHITALSTAITQMKVAPSRMNPIYFEVNLSCNSVIVTSSDCEPRYQADKPKLLRLSTRIPIRQMHLIKQVNLSGEVRWVGVYHSGEHKHYSGGASATQLGAVLFERDKVFLS